MGRRRSHRSAPASTGDVIITGASRGFGAAIAAGLAARGWRVFATMRDTNARDGLDHAIAAAGADRSNVTVLPLDVLRRQSIVDAVATVLRQTGGRLDAVVPNAGVLVGGAFEDTPSEAMRSVMDTNYFGAIETVRATLPALRASHGRIVLISSDSGLCGTPALSAYTASKYALEGWGESIAYELEPIGVAVSIIEPGPFRSDIYSRAAIYSSPPEGPYAELSSASETTLSRIGSDAADPDPVVGAVLRALSSRSPRLRYPVGREARLISVSRRVLPQRVFGALVRRATGTTLPRVDRRS
jgi:NAD(P)-dependent dehydrogenase (short-subunit alcohol dehydrogenase family)